MIMVLQSYCIFYSCVPVPVPVTRRRNSGSNVETRHRWGGIVPFSYDVTPLAVKPLNKFTGKDNEEQ
jgi:hypothetical protein